MRCTHITLSYSGNQFAPLTVNLHSVEKCNSHIFSLSPFVTSVKSRIIVCHYLSQASRVAPIAAYRLSSVPTIPSAKVSEEMTRTGPLLSDTSARNELPDFAGNWKDWTWLSCTADEENWLLLGREGDGAINCAWLLFLLLLAELCLENMCALLFRLLPPTPLLFVILFASGVTSTGALL